MAARVEALIDTLEKANTIAETELQKDKDYVAAKTDLDVAKRFETNRYRELSKTLGAVLPQNGESIAKDASVRKGGLPEIIADLKTQLKLLKNGDELSSQSFGEKDASEGGKYRKFTVTTRIVNDLIAGELGNALRKAYGGELEAEPVEMGDKSIALRFKNTALTKDAINTALQASLLKLSQETDYADIRTGSAEALR